MDSNSENYNFDGSTSETNNPYGEAKGSGTMNKVKDKLPIGKFKEYGKKAYSPLVEVVHKYQGEITPYIAALSKGLQGGVDTLTNESASETEKFVGGWFREAADGLREAQSKLEADDINEVVGFIEDQANKRPSFMFTSSYLTGLFFGRIGRHIGRTRIKNKNSSDIGSSFNESNFDIGDQSVH